LLIDFVCYSGEFDMLKAHLEYFDADLTIIYEGDKSFTGIPKQLSDLSEIVSDRVLYYPIEVGTDPNPWVNEYGQRRAAADYLMSLDIPDDATLMMCDVDEFPDRDTVQHYDQLTVWVMNKFQMSARWFQKQEMSTMTGSMKHFRGRDFVDIVQTRAGLNKVVGGYHFSSFLTEAELVTKWEHFSHQELVRGNMSDWVSECWRDGRAVENGDWLEQRETFDGIPEPVLRGPKHWLRGRAE